MVTDNFGLDLDLNKVDTHRVCNWAERTDGTDIDK